MLLAVNNMLEIASNEEKTPLLRERKKLSRDRCETCAASNKRNTFHPIRFPESPTNPAVRTSVICFFHLLRSFIPNYASGN